MDSLLEWFDSQFSAEMSVRARDRLEISLNEHRAKLEEQLAEAGRLKLAELDRKLAQLTELKLRQQENDTPLQEADRVLQWAEDTMAAIVGGEENPSKEVTICKEVEQNLHKGISDFKASLRAELEAVAITRSTTRLSEFGEQKLEELEGALQDVIQRLSAAVSRVDANAKAERESRRLQAEEHRQAKDRQKAEEREQMARDQQQKAAGESDPEADPDAALRCNQLYEDLKKNPQSWKEKRRQTLRTLSREL
eukprot:SAG11_NODE_873_length_6802_cov_2.257646_6_plen_252_part_01